MIDRKYRSGDLLKSPRGINYQVRSVVYGYSNDVLHLTNVKTGGKREMYVREVENWTHAPATPTESP